MDVTMLMLTSAVYRPFNFLFNFPFYYLFNSLLIFFLLIQVPFPQVIVGFAGDDIREEE